MGVFSGLVDQNKYFFLFLKYFQATTDTAELIPSSNSGRYTVKEEVQKVSCDWWRAGHVTSILASDWSRLRRLTTSAT